MYYEIHADDIEKRASAPEVLDLLGIYRELAQPDGLCPVQSLTRRLFPYFAPDLVILEPTASGDYLCSHFGPNVAAMAGFEMTSRRVSDFAAEIGEFLRAVCDRAVVERRPFLTLHRGRQARNVHLWEGLVLPGSNRDGESRVFALLKPRELRADFLHAVLEASPDGILALQSVRDADGSVVDAVVVGANRTSSDYTGHALDQLRDGRVLHLFPGFVATGIWERCLRVVESRTTERFETQYSLGGRDTWLRITVAPLGDGLMLSMADISQQKYALFEIEAAHASLALEVQRRERLEEELRNLVATDPLTLVWSRQGFRKVLEGQVRAARRYRYDLSVISVQLRDLDRIGILHGHEAVEGVLKRVAALLQDGTRVGVDIIGRVADDEFLILLPHTPEAGAAAVAERLQRSVQSTTFSYDEDPFTVAARIEVSAVKEAQAAAA